MEQLSCVRSNTGAMAEQGQASFKPHGTAQLCPKEHRSHGGAAETEEINNDLFKNTLGPVKQLMEESGLKQIPVDPDLREFKQLAEINNDLFIFIFGSEEEKLVVFFGVVVGLEVGPNSVRLEGAHLPNRIGGRKWQALAARRAGKADLLVVGSGEGRSGDRGDQQRSLQEHFWSSQAFDG